MTTVDKWGWKARIGMFIVSSEPVPEAEWWAMMPSGVSVHAARVTAPTPWARWASNRDAVELEADLERGARQFADMRLSAVVIAHSSSSIAGGQGWDDAVVKRLSEVVAPDTVVTTNGRDCQAALRALHVEHPFLVVKRLWGFEKVRYRGLAKNLARAFAAFALANLYLVRRQLVAHQVRCLL